MRLAVSVQGAEAFAARLRDFGKDAPLAEVRALNRTATTIQSRAVKAAADDTGLSQRVVRRSFALQRAARGRREAIIQATRVG